MSDSPVMKCPLCWSSSMEPYLWDRKGRPDIPKTRPELLKAINEVLPLDKFQEISKLTVPELKHVFKTDVKGTPHPQDPTLNMTSKGKEELIQILKNHGEAPNPPPGCKVNKGQLMIQIRQHWFAQCHIMKHVMEKPPPTTASTPMTSVVPTPESSSVVGSKNVKRTPPKAEWEVVSMAQDEIDPLAAQKIQQAEAAVMEAQAQVAQAMTNLAIEKQKAKVG